MLAEAAEMVATRQASKKTPRTYADYREMLEEKDLDIVLIATPDHWHALPMIAAVEAGADVYVQKPISVDVAEGQAMVAAARKHERVVQVGTQRRSTPHLIEARDRIIKRGQARQDRPRRDLLLLPHAEPAAIPPDTNPPEYLDYEMWTGPAPMRPYNPLVHPRGWRAFMEYGNGIMGDMCIHMLDMVRWMLGLGWPKRIASTGGILVDKGSKANIPDTQTATFDFGDLDVVWQHRTWGEPPDPKYPWGATFYGDKGTLKAERQQLRLHPARAAASRSTATSSYELEQYPEDKTEKDLEQHVAPAIRGHMQRLPGRDRHRAASRWPTSSRGTSRRPAASWPTSSLQLGRTLTWDAEAGQVVGDDEANRLLRRPYRTPWVHPAAGACE